MIDEVGIGRRSWSRVAGSMAAIALMVMSIGAANPALAAGVIGTGSGPTPPGPTPPAPPPSGAAASGPLIDFDSVSTPNGYVSGNAVTSYLSDHGVTFSTTYGVSPYIESYPDYLDTVSAANFFTVNGSAQNFDYDLTFITPASTVSFTIPGQGSATMAAWSATAYSASNAVLSELGDSSLTFPNSPTQTYTLDGPDISYVVFSSDAEGFAGDNLILDNLTLGVAEPADWTLMLLGVVSTGAALRGARAHCLNGRPST